jgi:hypothetical protein
MRYRRSAERIGPQLNTSFSSSQSLCVALHAVLIFGIKCGISVGIVLRMAAAERPIRASVVRIRAVASIAPDRC